MIKDVICGGTKAGPTASRREVPWVPNEASIVRLVGAILMEQHDEWQLQHRYLSLETITGSADGVAIDLPAALTKAA